LLFSERLNDEFVQDDDADEFISPEHRHSEFCSDGINIASDVVIFRIRLQVGYVYRPSFKRDSGRDGVTSRFDRMGVDEIDNLGRSVVESDRAIKIAIAPKT
jgi:hypothetical protein